MKRIVFLLAVVLLCGCISGACAESSGRFAEGEPHASTLDFRLYFETMSAAADACTLSIQQQIYDEETAQALLALVESDLSAMAAAAGISSAEFEAHTVYVVERPPNGMERQGNRIYCSKSDIQSGRYRVQLACAALGTEEYWKGVGLAGVAFGDAVNEAALTNAYQQMDDLDPLSLFISYYTAPFATAEETLLAEQTAAALCRFILDKHGAKAYAEEDCIRYRQEWLRQIGVDREYVDPYHAALANYRFMANASYPMLAVNQYNHRIYLAQMEDMKSARDLRMFLWDMQAGPQAVLSLVAEQAPERLEAVKARYEGRLWVYCGSQDGSYTYVEGRNMYLQLSYGYLHELGHILFPTPQGANFYSQMWQYEALCEYLGYTICPSYARQKSCYEALQFYTGLDQVEDKTPNQRFYVKLLDLYRRNAAFPSSPADVDAALFSRCMAAVPLVFPDAAPDADWVRPVSDTYPALRNTAGNELTYHQAYAFAAWLIENHSFATYLDFCLNGLDFEAAFAMPYEEAKAVWLAEFLPAIQNR